MKFRLTLFAILTLPMMIFWAAATHAFGSDAEMTGRQLLPNFNRESYVAQFEAPTADKKSSNSYFISGQTFRLGWKADEGPQNLYFALSLPDGSHMVFDTGLTKHRNANASAMHGACQFLTTSSNGKDARAMLLSEINTSTTPHTVDIFALPHLSDDDVRKIYDLICRHSPTPPSVRKLVPNATPFASINLNP